MANIVRDQKKKNKIRSHLRGNCTNFTLQSPFTGLGEYCYMRETCIKPFITPKGAVGSHLSPLTSLEAMSVGSEDFKFENEKNRGVEHYG